MNYRSPWSTLLYIMFSLFYLLLRKQIERTLYITGTGPLHVGVCSIDLSVIKSRCGLVIYDKRKWNITTKPNKCPLRKRLVYSQMYKDITLIYRYFIRVIFICRFVVWSLKTEADLISSQLFTSLFAMFWHFVTCFDSFLLCISRWQGSLTNISCVYFKSNQVKHFVEVVL